ncbi:hypothetical protein E5675_12270 [Sphingopyxis sp. PAMC25046]|uniref:hypothetical protein n=1 Tax=Sphingopyxis sp. PAMC25046 TaxID=2565556 RepID=UPI00109DD802|nr:hypothetical protein [Sphingopyxis sp. PAMC25046]QCB55129.1 hypothetical protein E5675_12270 [Sphingopyxis sp. PAMC25046]
MLAAVLLLSLTTIAAPEARQGVAADGVHVYAIDNNEIGKYDKATGKRIAGWEGDPKLFPHLNSCAVVKRDLVCAASNYPAVPMASTVEVFDTRTLKHVRSVSLGRMYGSLTAMDWHGGSWWAVFANYDDRGGEPGRDHRFTTLVRMDPSFRPLESWLFPDAVLASFAPKSSSGFAWGADGLMYASGHDKPEIYALKLPVAGPVLQLVATLPVPTEGQAIDWDPVEPRLLWSIDRRAKALHATRIPVAIPAGS